MSLKRHSRLNVSRALDCGEWDGVVCDGRGCSCPGTALFSRDRACPAHVLSVVGNVT
jgi:hypothetical protein